MRTGPGPQWLFRVACMAVVLASVGLLVGCSTDDTAPTRPPDTTPPAQTSLQIDSATDTTVTFSWQAPGDDGMSGDAHAYDLRYSTSPISEATWDEATPDPGLPTPSPPRSMERETVGPLTPGMTYYFAIRTRDEVSNWSPISRQIILTVPAGPDFPLLWGGRLLPDTGTSLTSFVYQIRHKLGGPIGTEPTIMPEVVINGDPYTMHYVPRTTPGDPLFEFDTPLEPGTYEFYFTFSDEEGRTSRLPNPGTWEGPQVATYEVQQPDFVFVPADTFAMGSADPFSDQLLRPQHDVILTHAFYMDRYEVTNSQLCDALNWAMEQELLEISGDTLTRDAASGRTLLRMSDRRDDAPHGILYSAAHGFTPVALREDWPATFVTWYGAAFYCNVRNWREGFASAYDLATGENLPRRRPQDTEGWRLPTEAEWEYVARYDDGRAYPSGNGLPTPGVDGNFAGIIGRPTPVGSFPEGSNALGIRDLMGNVYEWCNDWKGSYGGTTQVDPPGPRTGSLRVVRGGSWGSPWSELACVHRFGQRTGAARDGLGFRCVRLLPSE